MSNVKRLASNTSPGNDIAAAEADHDPVKVTISLSPVTQFIIEAALMKRTRSSAVRQLLESAALDLLEVKGYTLDSDDFKEKYYRWLTRVPQVETNPHTGEEEEYVETIRL